MNVDSDPKFDAFATAACIVSLIFFSTASIFIKYLSGFIDSWTQNLLRYSAACLFWLPFLLLAVKRGRITKKVWVRAILPAVVNVIMQSLWARTLYYIDPAFTTLLMKSSIIWVVGFSVIFFAEEKGLIRSNRLWLGLGLSLVGVVGVLANKEGFATHGTLTGIILALSGAFMWGAYTVSVKMAFKDIDSRSGFSVISIYTVAGLGLLAMKFGKPAECLNMAAWPWACVVISGIVCIALSHVLFYTAIKRIGATIPSLVLLSTPFIVLGLSYAVFGERLTVPQLIFGVVLLIGCACAIRAQQHLRPSRIVPPGR